MTRDPGGASRAESDERPAIVVEELCKSYGSGASAVDAVTDVTFSVDPGEIVGLLGPNGAGKTTTIKTLLGLVVPTSGTVRVNGHDVEEDPSSVYRHVSGMFEGARNLYWRLTVAENMTFFARLHDVDLDDQGERIGRLLALVGLEDRRDDVVRSLSRGQKQRVAIACALVRDPSVLILDEPTLGLDVGARRDLQAELQRLAEAEGITVLLSSHDMDVVETVCDRVIVVNEGQVVADETVEELVGTFRSNRYRVTVEGDVADHARRTLETEFDVDDWTTDPGNTSFVVEPSAETDLSGVLEWLAAAGRPVESMTRVRPDFEEVFLRLTGGEDDARNDRQEVRA